MTVPGANRASSRVAVIGGGPAGYFGAITCAETFPDTRVTLFESTHKPLVKVLISGGGRCNVTHHCFDPAELVRAYPRGHDELRGPFSRFQPRDTVRWFEDRGVRLKTENDGRMFPVTDSSETIASCLRRVAAEAGVVVRLAARVVAVRKSGAAALSAFEVELKDAPAERFDRVLMATGSAPSGYKIAAGLGHAITSLAPSLFTFKVADRRLSGLSGIGFPKVHLSLSVGDRAFEQTGPMLITHWGLSGPAVLKLSAWAARELYAANYRAALTVSYLPDLTPQAVAEQLAGIKQQHARRTVAGDNLADIPKRFWESLVGASDIPSDLTWANVTKEQVFALTRELTAGRYEVSGKGEFKEEFVTCGGVSLKEVDFRTMRSKLVPGLFFAGEILDIDGITGGFNFQSAWTTGWIAGSHLGQ